MLVLFTGGRASGKSTIAKALYSMLDTADFDYVHQNTWRKYVRNLFSKLSWNLYFLTYFRWRICSVYFKRSYRDILKGRSKGSLSRIIRPCIFSYYLQKLARKKVNCVVYESDFLTWSADKALDNNFDDDEVRHFFTQVILPLVGNIVVVVCDIPVAEAVKRWRIRDKKVLSADEVDHWIEKRKAWKDARNQVLDVVSTVPRITVIYLDSLKEPDNNASRIFTLIKALN
jgi:hypothetical protein